MTHAPIEEIVSEISAGAMVVMVDDEFRENEGDLIMAAESVSPDAVNFMAKYGRGLICLTLTPDHCEQLKLPLMVANNDLQTTNFTLSIEAKEGVTTGISAKDRAHTIRVAVAPNASPQDIVSPGHIFPLMAQPGGVLTRAGHTETGCDLARLAGLTPAAVIVEIMNDDGSMARHKDLVLFAKKHQLKMGTIRDLISYRTQHERTVHPMQKFEVNTAQGPFMLHAYRDELHQTVHLAMTCGTIERDKDTLVRVHIENSLTDTVGITDKALGWPLHDAMQRIQQEKNGVVVILRWPDRYLALKEEIDALTQPQECHKTNPNHYWALGVGAQILKDLNVGRMRLMSAPKYFHGLSGFGLTIDQYIDNGNDDD